MWLMSPMNRLRDAPRRTGQPKPVKEREVLQQAQVVRLGLAEADAGIDDDALARDAEGDQRLDALPASQS